jgi:hypothetical protein
VSLLQKWSVLPYYNAPFKKVMVCSENIFRDIIPGTIIRELLQVQREAYQQIYKLTWRFI